MINGSLNEKSSNMKTTKNILTKVSFFLFVALSLTGVTLQSTAQPTTKADTLPKNEYGCVKWGPDSSKTVEKLSLYYEYYKQDDYDEALQHVRYVYDNAPGTKEYPYVHGLKMYKTKLKQAKDKELKKKLTDTLMALYDQRLRCFGPENDDVLGRKAISMVQYQKDSTEKIYQTFRKSKEIAGDKWESYFLHPYIYAVIRAFKDDIVDKKKFLAEYDDVVNIIDHNVENNKEKKAKYEKAREKIDKLMTKTNLLNCDNLRKILGEQYEKNPQDTALWKRIFSQMSRQKCFEDSLFLVATEKYNEVKPTASKSYFLARSFKKKGVINTAMKFYEKAIELEEDDEEKADYHFEIAKIHKKRDNYPAARQTALKAAELKDNWGEPYMFIGDLYASSGPKCGEGTGFKSQVVAWPAVDMYEKAKRIDPSIKERANANIENYKSYFPKKEECFFRDLKNGDDYKVECWIERSTTVRCKEKEQ